MQPQSNQAGQGLSLRAGAALLARLLYRGATHICQAPALGTAPGEAHGFPKAGDNGQRDAGISVQAGETVGRGPGGLL